MFSRFKMLAFSLGGFILTLVTLGFYARYQKSRADAAEKEAQRNQQLIEQSQAINQQLSQVRQSHRQEQAQNERKKRRRNFFGR